MDECKKHPHGLLKSVDSGRYAGYEDTWERVPCFCERTAHGLEEEGVPITTSTEHFWFIDEDGLWTLRSI